MKIWNYMIIMLTMIIFLEFVGFHAIANQELNSKLNISINNQTSVLEASDVTQSPFYNNLFAGGGILIAFGVGLAIVVGFYTRTFDWKIVIAPFMTGTIVLFAATGIQIVAFAQAQGQGWLTAIVATIFLPLTVGFIYSIVEFFAGGGD